MESILDNDLFRTTDLALASVINLYYPLELVDRSDQRKIVFLFRTCPELVELVQHYWKKELKIEPISHFESIKLLKSRIYELQN